MTFWTHEERRLGLDTDEARAMFDERLALARAGVALPGMDLGPNEAYALDIGMSAARERAPEPYQQALAELAAKCIVTPVETPKGTGYKVKLPPEIAATLDEVTIDRAELYAWLDAYAPHVSASMPDDIMKEPT